MSNHLDKNYTIGEISDLQDKGVQVREFENTERAKKFKALQEFLQEESNRRKGGKAETVRLAIDLAFDNLESLEEEHEEAKAHLKSVVDYKGKVIDRLKED